MINKSDLVSNEHIERRIQKRITKKCSVNNQTLQLNDYHMKKDVFLGDYVNFECLEFPSNEQGVVVQPMLSAVGF